jgi:hypothetical protein
MCEDIIKLNVKEIIYLVSVGIESSDWLRLKQLQNFWSRKKARSACQFLKKNAV